MTKDNKNDGLGGAFGGPAGRSKEEAIAEYAKAITEYAKALAEMLGLDEETLGKAMAEPILQPGDARRTTRQWTSPTVFDEIEHGLDPELSKAFSSVIEEGQLTTGNRTAAEKPIMIFSAISTGKTENLKRLKELFGGEDQILHLDVRDFQEEPSAINRLLGHPPGSEGSRITIIGATTDAEYAEAIKADKELTRRFETATTGASGHRKSNIRFDGDAGIGKTALMEAIKIMIERSGGAAREIPVHTKPAKQKSPGPQ